MASNAYVSYYDKSLNATQIFKCTLFIYKSVDMRAVPALNTWNLRNFQHVINGWHAGVLAVSWPCILSSFDFHYWWPCIFVIRWHFWFSVKFTPVDTGISASTENFLEFAHARFAQQFIKKVWTNYC